MNTFFKLVSILVIVSTLSCKKEPQPSVKDITGRWRITTSYIDSNQNGIMEAKDMILNNPDIFKWQYQFNENGTCKEIFDTVVWTELTWQLNKDKLELFSLNGKSNITYDIVAFTDNSMTWHYYGDVLRSWIIWTKQ